MKFALEIIVHGLAGSCQVSLILLEGNKMRWYLSIGSEIDGRAVGLIPCVSIHTMFCFPIPTDSNYVAIVNDTGYESDVSQRQELVIDDEQNNPNVVDPFNAYSSGGIMEVNIFINLILKCYLLF